MAPELEFVAIIATSIGSSVLAVMHERRKRRGGNGTAAVATAEALNALEREYREHVEEDAHWHGTIDAELSSVGRSLDEIKAWLLRIDNRIQDGERRRR